MKQIFITRDDSGVVTFTTVSVNETETVFFTNLDPDDEHWPEIAANKLGPAPSPNSSQCNPNPDGADPPITITYGCNIGGHTERGTINIFAQLAPVNQNLGIVPAGQPITQRQLVSGGISPYRISGRVFQVSGSGGEVQNGMVPGLHLISTDDNNGVVVAGTPTTPGVYAFTFEVNDGAGGNLQQALYEITVS